MDSKSKTWFISDLHLDESRPHLLKLFYEFIDSIHNQTEALYILGDLFEFWIGDDIIETSFGKDYLPVLDKLKSLTESGIPVYFIQGNRDFLCQKKFMDHTGVQLLPDHHVIDLYGTPTLIMHGDTLCTDDKSYQRLRWVLRRKIIQNLYLSLSTKRRAGMAQGVRKVTSKSTQQKSYEILDVNQQAVEQEMKKAGVLQLIHGHTHRPAEHQLGLNGQSAKRIVLGDWKDKACFLACDQDSMEFVF